ncbi:hypothetical protein G6F46_014812 [Rhizopus delemar]|nr:hypothetical protein G6F46_014812 [Rhizopus delemar]
MLRVGAQAQQARAVGHRKILPAGLGQHPFTGLEIRMVGRLHTCHGATHHGLADLDRFGIGRRIAHAAAHIGIQREIHGAQQHLTWAGLRDIPRFQPEIAVCGFAVWARGKHDTAADRR